MYVDPPATHVHARHRESVLIKASFLPKSSYRGQMSINNLLTNGFGFVK